MGATIVALGDPQQQRRLLQEGLCISLERGPPHAYCELWRGDHSPGQAYCAGVYVSPTQAQQHRGNAGCAHWCTLCSVHSVQSAILVTLALLLPPSSQCPDDGWSC